MTLPFDRTFMLALDRDIKAPHSRTHKTLDHLNAAGISAEIFPGFDGGITGLTTNHTYEIDNPGTNYRIGPRTISLYLGHLAMWRMCEFLEGDSFLILEDDVRFNPGWEEHFAFAFPALPIDWDLLYIGSCCAQGHGHHPRQVSGHLHQVGYALCTHAYAVRKKALPVLRQACEKIYAGVDIAMCLHGIPQLKTYAFLPRLADQFETEIAP
jgi:GR25 family glycosyltransferase involved in LPS biosynthesis